MIDQPTAFMSRLTPIHARALRLAAYKNGHQPGTMMRLVITDWLEREGYGAAVRRELEELEPAAE